MGKQRKQRSHVSKPARDDIANASAADGLERTLSRTSASWTRYLTRLQDETDHFVGTWFGICMETVGRFARCRTFADLVDTQARFYGDLLADFVDEGAMMTSALCEVLPEVSAAPDKNGARI